jgi:hypothetical protein
VRSVFTLLLGSRRANRKRCSGTKIVAGMLTPDARDHESSLVLGRC